MAPSKIARILLQHVRQETEDEEGRRDLIRFRRAKTLGVGTPALPVVRLAVAGLLKSGLEEVSDMGVMSRIRLGFSSSGLSGVAGVSERFCEVVLSACGGASVI